MSILTRYLSEPEAELLYRHYPKLREAPEKWCPTCQGDRVYVWEGKRVSCDCAHQTALHKHYLNAGIGVTYQRLRWADYQRRDEAVQKVMSYLNEHRAYIHRGTGVLLTGPVGTGKTLLANLLLKDLVHLGYRCYATTFAGCIDQFTAGWYDQDDKRRFADRFMHSDVLLLDDVGREMRTRNNLPESTFDNILRTRVQSARPTILTTNMEPDELRSGYGSGVLSLLYESSLRFEVPGDDFRPQAIERTKGEVGSGETRPIF